MSEAFAPPANRAPLPANSMIASFLIVSSSPNAALWLKAFHLFSFPKIEGRRDAGTLTQRIVPLAGWGLPHPKPGLRRSATLCKSGRGQDLQSFKPRHYSAARQRPIGAQTYPFRSG